MDYIKLSKKYIDISNNDLSAKDLETLRKLIKYHSNLYYNYDSPIISDSEYDDLFKKLEFLEKKLNTSFKQTSLVWAEIIESTFKKTLHSRPMISLANTYNSEELKDFDTRLKKILDLKKSDEIEYALEFKLDWLWIELIYENWNFVQAITRGNWIEWEDVTENVRQIDNIPKKIKYNHRFEVRGEIIMPLSIFEKINKDALKSKQKIFSNPRNAASWSIRVKDINITKKRGLKFFAYDMWNFEEFRNWIWATRYVEVIKSFKKMWFEIIEFLEIYRWIDKVIEKINNFWDIVKKLDYDVDWLVLKVNDISLWNEIGWTEHHPRYAVAYKFPAQVLTTKILSVDHNVWRTWTITPLAWVEPVKLSWAIIRKATLHNYEEVEKLDIRIWDNVFIKRAWEVIPKIISVVENQNREKLEKVLPPIYCPSCKTKVMKDEDKVRYYCPNSFDCPAQHIEKLIFAVSKSWFDIDWLWDKQIETFLNEWIIKNIVDIFYLKDKKDDILLLDWYKDKSVNNLIEAIEKAKKQDINTFLTALWIPWVGKKTAKIISVLFEWKNDLLKFNHTQEELEELNEIWPELAANIVSYFNDDSHKKIIEELLNVIDIRFYKKKEIVWNSIFRWKKMCVTWSFEKEWKKVSRDDLILMLENVWWEFVSSVSKKTDYLLAWENSWSKIQKANSLKVEIIDLKYFLENL